MKRIKKNTIAIFVLFSNLSVFAQTTPPDPGGPGPLEPPVPIDGSGLLMLILMAFLLGIYVIYKHKLKTKASV